MMSSLVICAGEELPYVAALSVLSLARQWLGKSRNLVAEQGARVRAIVLLVWRWLECRQAMPPFSGRMQGQEHCALRRRDGILTHEIFLQTYYIITFEKVFLIQNIQLGCHCHLALSLRSECP